VEDPEALVTWPTEGVASKIKLIPSHKRLRYAIQSLNDFEKMYNRAEEEASGHAKVISGYQAIQLQKQAQIDLLADTIARQNKEIQGYQSTQHEHKQTIADQSHVIETGTIERNALKKVIRDYGATNELLLTQRDQAIDAKQAAEARLSDLQAALELERQRFDSSIVHEREVTAGLRDRLGLSPRDTSQTPVNHKPVSSRPPTWNQQAVNLERAAQKITNDAKEAIWKKKIEEAEAKDAGNSGTAEESARPTE